MPQYQNFDADDRIIETAKVTTGYFSDGTGTLAGASMGTASLTASQEQYYANVQASSTDQFSVTFGSQPGSGSADTTSHTKAVYQYYADQLLFPNEIESIGFQFVSGTTTDDVWFLVGERARMKDRINRKNWTITLDGTTDGHITSGAEGLSLTDDSDTTVATSTPVGPRFNIVSGALGTVHTAASTKCYGWFYPNVGVMAFNGTQLSASIPGGHISCGSAAAVVNTEHIGFATDTATTAKNHLKLFHSLQSGSVTMRSEEDQITTSYFVRVKAAHYNFSNNPTFISGTDATFSISEFTGNPQTFITTIGLHDAQGTCVAVGRLSTPVLKNFSTEFTAKVNLVH